MKICLIGAGSTVFAKNLLADFLLIPDLEGFQIALFDIDAERLKVSARVCERLIAQSGKQVVVTLTQDRKAALKGANYVLSMMQVGGYKPATVLDFEIPKKYGLRQTIADTLGIGGIMRALRTIPVMWEIATEIEQLCPDAYWLNYVNPMAMLCIAVAKRFAGLRLVGLCHSVQGTAEQLARDLNMPHQELDYFCAGINHVAFYLKLCRKQNGKLVDLYPQLHQLAADSIERNDYEPIHDVTKPNFIRYQILKHFGFFVTESSEHFAEYVPWFIKSAQPELVEQFKIPLDEYIERGENQIAGWQNLRQNLEQEPLSLKRSHEYASFIIEALETGKPAQVYGNVPNHSLISNLPADCCVEVPCLVDRTGIHPLSVGQLPLQLACLMQTNINVQLLTVEAALQKNKAAVYQAAMLDPHTAAELNLDQICNLVDELLAAHQGWLGEFN